MKVRVHLFAQLAAAAGASEFELDLDEACSAQDLVRRLSSEHGDEFGALVLGADGRLAPAVLQFVDERQVRWEQVVELVDGSQLLLASAVAGG